MAPHQARAPDEIEGFATRTDILPGDPLRLKISTTAPSYQIHAYRAGWYGGRLMREVWTSGVLAGHREVHREDVLDLPADLPAGGWIS